MSCIKNLDFCKLNLWLSNAKALKAQLSSFDHAPRSWLAGWHYSFPVVDQGCQNVDRIPGVWQVNHQKNIETCRKPPDACDQLLPMKGISHHITILCPCIFQREWSLYKYAENPATVSSVINSLSCLNFPFPINFAHFVQFFQLARGS